MNPMDPMKHYVLMEHIARRPFLRFLVGMRDVEPKLPVREALKAAIVEKAESPAWITASACTRAASS